MRVAPEHRFGFCLQTNVESALSMYRELAAWLFEAPPRRHAAAGPGAARPRRSSPTRPGTSAAYRREGLDFVIGAAADGSLHASVTVSHAAGEMQSLPPMDELPLVPVEREDSFLLKLPIADSDLLAVFFNPARRGGCADVPPLRWAGAPSGREEISARVVDPALPPFDSR